MSGRLLLEMLHGRFGEALGWTLVHSVWEIAGIGVAGWIGLWMGKRLSAGARYVLACAVMGLMVAAPVGTFLRVLLPAPRAVVPVARNAPNMAGPAAAEGTPMVAEGAWTTEVRAVEPGRSPISARLSRAIEPALPYALAAYFVGVIFLSLRLAGGCWRLARLRRTGRAAPAGLLETVEQLRKRMGISRAVRVLETLRVEVPTLVGMLRPVIFLPISALTGLSTEQLAALLAHELAHIRRHDYLVNLLQTAIETVLFYHPAVWWTAARIRQEREHCCDDVAVAVVADRLGYARALASMETLRAAPAGVGAALAIGARSGALLPRIRRILGMGPAAGRVGSPASASTVAAIVILLAAAAIYVGCRQSTRAVAPGSGSGQDGTASGPAITFHARIVTVSDDALFHLPVLWNPALKVLGQVADVYADSSGDHRTVRRATAAEAGPATMPGATREDQETSEAAILDGAMSQDILAEMQKDKQTVVLSSPRITARSGQPAVLRLSQQEQNYVKSFSQTPATQPGDKPGYQLNVATLTIGLTLSLNGSLSPDGQMVKTAVGFKNVTLDGIDTFTLAADDQPPPPHGEVGIGPPFVQLPKMTEVSVGAVAEIPLGSTLWIRGPAVSEEREQTAGVPGLSALPGVGGLFTKHTYAKTTAHLLILITPTLGQDESEAAVTSGERTQAGGAVKTEPADSWFGEPNFEEVKPVGRGGIQDAPPIETTVELFAVPTAFLDDFRVGGDLNMPLGVGRAPRPVASGEPQGSIADVHGSVIDDFTLKLFEQATAQDKRTQKSGAYTVKTANRQPVTIPIRCPAAPANAKDHATATGPAADAHGTELRFIATLSADRRWVVLQLGPDVISASRGMGQHAAFLSDPPKVPQFISVPVGGTLLVNLGPQSGNVGDKDAKQVMLLLEPRMAGGAGKPAQATVPGVP